MVHSGARSDEKVCTRCGDAFEGGRRDRMYCSSRCQRRAASERRFASGRLAEQCARRREKNVAWQRVNRHRYYLERTCEGCGFVFSTKHGARTCSSMCRSWCRHGEWPRSDLPRSTAVPKEHPSRVEPKPRFAVGWCRDCGECFVMDRQQCHSLSYVFCSRRCSRRSHRRRYDASRRSGVACAATFAAREVFVRDKWRCGLCGYKIRRKVGWNHPKAATIDHVVPLARGGTHQLANVQAAHRECNVRKNAFGGGEQLALI